MRIITLILLTFIPLASASTLDNIKTWRVFLSAGLGPFQGMTLPSGDVLQRNGSQLYRLQLTKRYDHFIYGMGYGNAESEYISMATGKRTEYELEQKHLFFVFGYATKVYNDPDSLLYINLMLGSNELSASGDGDIKTQDRSQMYGLTFASDIPINDNFNYTFGGSIVFFNNDNFKINGVEFDTEGSRGDVLLELGLSYNF